MKAYSRIQTDETMRETVSHGSDDHPFRYYYEDIWQFDLHCVDWHWHPEVEFVCIEKGTADFYIGGGKYTLGAGTGIFINSQVIHRFEAAESVIIPNIVFSPLLLAAEDSLIYRKYVCPVIISSADCLIFSPHIPWQKDILTKLHEVFAIQEEEDMRELRTAETLLSLWGIIYDNLRTSESFQRKKAAAHTEARLQIMMQFIHKNYREHITLEDIAGAVSLSKSSALDLFRKYLRTSPVSYLVNYRLKRAAKLLDASDYSISSAANSTGFENTGYFCRSFKKLFGVTPTEYRKRQRTDL